MWSKMATRWRRKDGHLKPGKGRFLSNNNPDECILNTDIEMDTQSCVDHSVLAIFEDTSVLTQEKAAVEEDSEQLLSALTEMLERVEDDDDCLSPFNTLPETPLLSSQDPADNEKPINTKVEAEVEVFTTVSLVNLVKIMHPYCLKLQVEEEQGKVSKNNVLFSKEEVWKYERPTEDIDEEINVVSDDEAPMETTHTEKELDNNCKPLKSALLNSSPSKGHHPPKEKKRVSFGSVQVTSLDLESQTGAITSPATHQSPKALNNTADSALESQISSENSQMFDARPQKSEKKRKSLSLQQYRQLREKRQPLVEKQGNYTTKWPSVSVPPKELTPILGVQGQKLAVFKPFTNQQSNRSHDSKMPSNVHHLKTKPSSSDVQLKAKRHKSISKISHVAPLPDVNVAVCGKSPTKTPTILSSDPPNPVLLPLPVNQSPKSEPASEIKPNENTEACTSPQVAEKVFEITDNSTPKLNIQSSTEDNKLILKTLDLTNQCSEVPVECAPSMPYSYEPPTPVSTPVKEMTPEVPFTITPPPLQLCSPLNTSSGIIASDLTSLLEQFEKTQAKEEEQSERALQVNTKHLCDLKNAASNSILQTDQVLAPDPALLTPQTKALKSTSHSIASLAPLRCGPNLKIPEPLGTEVVLSTQEQPARRKTPQVKSIQIIDPRPLPSKKTYPSISESAAVYTPSHIYSSISSDHDYCSASKNVDDCNKNTKLSGNSESVHDRNESPSAPSSCSNQTSEAKETNQTFENVQDISRTKQPSNQSTLLIETAKKHISSLPDVRLDTCIPPTPPPSPPYRGRGHDKRTFRRRSHHSDSSSSSSTSSYSSSSSRSRSPIRQNHHHQSSDSSSCSSSPSRSVSRSPPRHKRSYSKARLSRSKSRSRSRSWSRSRSRSQSPPRKRWRDVCRNREARKLQREQEIRMQKLRAIDERRVVYVGRIRRTMTHDELRERFSQFGQVECVSLHFRDRGDHYGFVTFYNMEHAFAAIDNGGKLRRPDELPFDICFGGRRQFCNTNYADLDANRDAEMSPVRNRYEDVDFDLLLKQAQKGLKR